jgi:hypothetical protein
MANMLYGMIEFSVGVIIASPVVATLCALYSSTVHPQQEPYNDVDYEYDENYWYEKKWHKNDWDEDVTLSGLDYPGKPDQRTRKRVSIAMKGKPGDGPVQTYEYWSSESSASEEIEASEPLARLNDTETHMRSTLKGNRGSKVYDINQQTAFLGESLLEPRKVRVRWICVSRYPSLERLLSYITNLELITCLALRQNIV